MKITNRQSQSNPVLDVLYLTYDRSKGNTIWTELAKVGYRIKVTYSFGEALLCLRQMNFAALIVGHMIPARDGVLLASDVRRSGSGGKIIFLHLDSVPNVKNADAVASIHGGVDLLVGSSEGLLSPENI